MKFAILFLCIALGIFAFVDAGVVERHRFGELRKRVAEPKQQCTSKTHAPAHKKEPIETSKSSHKHANSNKAGQKGGSNNGAVTSSTSVAATETTANVNKGGNKKNKGTTTTTAASDTASASVTAATTSASDSASSSADPPPAATDPPAAATNTDTATATSNGGSNTCLAAGALQTGSEQTGQTGNITAGQVPSQTSDNNFINVCDGQTLTNGLQIITGSCNGIPLGFIPAKANMPSSLITFPEHNQDIAANTTFQIAVTQIGMELGSFTNAKLTYYSAPTFLNSNGLIIGHTHVSVQDLGGSFTPTQPLDPTKFAFFLGINTPADSNGQVFANVPNGLPPGFYRVCTMVGNANHSPLQMPVAQRGAQDDCHYFSVGQGSSSSSTSSGQSTSGSDPSANTSSAADPPSSTSSAADAASSTSSAASTATKAAGGRGGKKGGNRGKGRF